MRRPDQLRRQAALAASASVAFALFVAFLTFLGLGREGRLGFVGFNLAGLVEGVVFLAAFVTALGWVRSALRLPSPTLLSFGLVAPPTARRVAERVPLVDAAGVLQTLADHRVVIVEEGGVPIGVSLGIGGMVAIALANSDAQLFGLLAAPQNFYASLAKYPLLALPMFVLVGSIFDRSGVAQRMVTFAIAVVGRGPGMLPMVAILVAMVLGGISGSGPANAAAVGGVMIAAMSRAGYPAAFSASIVWMTSCWARGFPNVTLV